MRLISLSPPAASRARTARRVAIASAIVFVLSLLVVGQGYQGGLAPLIASAAGLIAGVTRWLAMREIDGHGDTAVARLSDTMPVMRSHVPGHEIIDAMAHLRDHTHVLVHGREGWRVAPVQPIIDQALAGEDDVHVWALGRRPRWVSPDHPIDRLPRAPYAGEVWLVGGSEPPRVLMHDDLLAAPLPEDPAPMTGIDFDMPIVDVSASAREALR